MVEINDVNLICDSTYSEQIQSLINDVIVLSAISEKLKVEKLFVVKPHTTFIGFRIDVNDYFFINVSFFTNTHIMRRSKSLSKVKELKLDGFNCSFTSNFVSKMKHDDLYVQYKDGNYFLNISDFKKIIIVLEKIKDIVCNY